MKLSPTEVANFIDAQNTLWKDLNDLQPIKLKHNYFSHEHELVNRVDREMFYDGFLAMSENFLLVEDGQGGRSVLVPKGMNLKDEALNFVTEESKKDGFNFRWKDEKKDENVKSAIFVSISGVSFAVRRNQFSDADWLNINDALHNDPDFNAWKARKESNSSKVIDAKPRPRSKQPKIMAVPGSSQQPQTYRLSEEFRNNFIGLYEEQHFNGSSDDWREKVILMIAAELRQNPQLNGWSEPEKMAYTNLSGPLQHKQSKFNMQAWTDFASVLKDSPDFRKPSSKPQESVERSPVATSPRSARKTSLSPQFRQELKNMFAAHDDQTRQNGRQYVPMRNGLKYVRTLIGNELKYNSDLIGWFGVERDAFVNLQKALGSEDPADGANAWVAFRAVMEKHVDRQPIANSVKAAVRPDVINVKPLVMGKVGYMFIPKTIRQVNLWTLHSSTIRSR